MRNVRAMFNGTAFAAIGAARGLYQRTSGGMCRCGRTRTELRFTTSKARFPAGGCAVGTGVQLRCRAAAVATVARAGDGRPPPVGAGQCLPDPRHHRLGRPVCGAATPRWDVAIPDRVGGWPAVHFTVLGTTLLRAVPRGRPDHARRLPFSRSLLTTTPCPT